MTSIVLPVVSLVTLFATPPEIISTSVQAAVRSTHAVASSKNVFNVMDYGAKGDGKTLDSVAIASAYAACRSAGPTGGTVIFPGGHIFLTAPWEIACNNSVTILQATAIVTCVNSTNDYPLGEDPCPEPSQGSYW